MLGFEFFIGLAVLFLFQMWWHREKNLPPGPSGWPVVGYLPHLGTEAYKTLHALTQKYGPTFSFYLGRKLVVVLGTFDAVKEGLTDSKILDRPKNPPNHLLPDSTNLSVANGRAWKEQRRFTIRVLRDLGMSKSRMENIIQEELKKLIEIIDSKDGEAFNLDEILLPSVSNIILTLLTGSPLDFNDKDRLFLNKMLQTMVLFFRPTRVHAFFPSLRQWLAKLKIWGYDRAEYYMEKFSNYIIAQIENHKKSVDSKERPDYINSYLLTLESKKNCESSFSEKMLKGNFQSLFSAGSTPSRATVEWCLLAMIRHPHIQRAVHEELDTLLPRNQPPTWKDHPNLPFTLSVVYEVLRHNSIVPIPLLRCTSERTRISGHDVPKGTIVISNIWSVHHDPQHWEDPFTFNPERFLKDGKAVRPPAFMPFSYGKRKCPGEDMAMALVFLYFATLMQRYTVSIPNEGTDVRQLLGVANVALLEKVCLKKRFQ
ncbi:cytochrome P450 2J6-like [Argiope bruennichi]|uniref:cytochrome P450 2J6-like n=1 Tax=Argiope bruennichi TaxID=94029 RepID=UPI00249514D1|nr:cytochrome P450 2J6-like [Argiope bruennichi]